MMTCLDLMFAKLKHIGTCVSVSDHDISWYNLAGEKYYIFWGNFACSDGRVAWLQVDDHDQYLLRIFENGDSFNLPFPDYGTCSGCSCLFLEWEEDHLSFGYRDAQDVFICSIKGQHIKTFRFRGGRLSRSETSTKTKKVAACNDPNPVHFSPKEAVTAAVVQSAPPMLLPAPALSV